MIKLGTRAKLKFHGPEGTVAARLEFMGGFTQYRLDYLDKGGVLQERYVTEVELEISDDGKDKGTFQ